MNYIRTLALAWPALVFAADAPPLHARDDGAAAPTSAVEEPLPLSAEASPAEHEAGDVARMRLREGTRLNDVSGHFRQDGDLLTFIDASNREIGGLPNLNLERIIRMLKTVEAPESVTWSVSGAVTEFSGRNYLLISRAVYKSSAPPPPEDLSAPPQPKGEATDGAADSR